MRRVRRKGRRRHADGAVYLLFICLQHSVVRVTCERVHVFTHDYVCT